MCVISHWPSDMLAQRFLAGMEFVAEGTLVVFPLDGCVTGVLLLVHSEVGLGGVPLLTDIALKRLFSCVNSGVTLIFSYKNNNIVAKNNYVLQQWTCVFVITVHNITTTNNNNNNTINNKIKQPVTVGKTRILDRRSFLIVNYFYIYCEHDQRVVRKYITYTRLCAFTVCFSHLYGQMSYHTWGIWGSSCLSSGWWLVPNPLGKRGLWPARLNPVL